jgi:hypothetical protein
MSKRALRRHHRARLVARARKIRRRWWRSWTPDQSEWVPGEGRVFAKRAVDHTQADASAAKYVDHLAACSCSGCGNPRRFGGYAAPVLTRQERLVILYLREVLSELAVERDEY